MLRGVVAAIALAAGVPSAGAPLEILQSGHPVAEVAIASEPAFRFVIDTAASVSAVTSDLVKRQPALFGQAGRAELAGATGQVAISTFVLPSVSVSGKGFTDVTVAALPPSPVDKLGIDGIIGADILSKYVFELDLVAKKWALTDSVDPELIEEKAKPTPFTYSLGRAPVIPVVVEGKTINAIVDTGAKSTIMNWSAAKLLGRTEAANLDVGDRVEGATGSAANVRSTNISGLKIGTVTRPEMSVRIVDLPVFAASGFKLSDPVILLGIDAFADGRLVVDYPGMRLFYQNDRTRNL